MITKEECMSYILQRVPQFQKKWEEHSNYWEGERAGLCNDISSFTRFTTEEIRSENLELLETIFVLVEKLLVEGEEEVKTAVYTCFLENLLNIASTGVIKSSRFTTLLGENSRVFCKKLDDFTGAITIGL